MSNGFFSSGFQARNNAGRCGHAYAVRCPPAVSRDPPAAGAAAIPSEPRSVAGFPLLCRIRAWRSFLAAGPESLQWLPLPRPSTYAGLAPASAISGIRSVARSRCTLTRPEAARFITQVENSRLLGRHHAAKGRDDRALPATIKGWPPPGGTRYRNRREGDRARSPKTHQPSPEVCPDTRLTQANQNRFASTEDHGPSGLAQASRIDRSTVGSRGANHLVLQRILPVSPCQIADFLPK